MKYIIKNCPNLTKSYYATGEIIENQCGCTDDNMCEHINNCLLKQVANKLNNFWCDAVGKSFDEEETYAYISQKIGDIYDLFEIREAEDV